MMMGSLVTWPPNAGPVLTIAGPQRTAAGVDAWNPKEWSRKLASYRSSSARRAVVELAATLLPFFVCWAAMICAVNVHQLWLTVPLLLPTAFFVVRLFAIQHDCGHGSFFPRKVANDWTGRVLGAFTLTPYDYWRRSHAIHHATSGNLDARGIGDVDTLTVREYQSRSAWGRFRYRAYRHPLVMFGLGPAYLFVLQYRLPIGALRRAEPWFSTMSTNVVITLMTVALIWTLGPTVFLLVQLPVILLAASIGVWLFYVQHQFEHTHWRREGDWNLQEAAFHGSSHYDLPWILRWLTANLGVHHVHHLVSRIPCYRLGEVLRTFPELRGVGRINLVQSLGCVRLVLWDERSGRLISFADARNIALTAS